MRLLLAAFAALCLTACGPVLTAASVTSAVTSPEPLGAEFTFDERGQAAVTLLYNAAASTYRTARTSGICDSACRDQWRPILLEARQYHLAAREAYRLGQETTWRDRVGRLKALNDRIRARFPTSN